MIIISIALGIVLGFALLAILRWIWHVIVFFYEWWEDSRAEETLATAADQRTKDAARSAGEKSNVKWVACVLVSW